MSSTELKNQIISKIAAIEDKGILEEIYQMISLEARMDAVYRLNEDERKAVDAGLEDIKAGRVYSSEAAEKMIKEWQKQ